MQDHFATYRAAVKNLSVHPDSATDQFIVDLWDTSKKLFNENVKIKDDLNEVRKRNAEMYSEIDTLETKLARTCPTPFNTVQPVDWLQVLSAQHIGKESM